MSLRSHRFDRPDPTFIPYGLREVGIGGDSSLATRTGTGLTSSAVFGHRRCCG